MPALSPFSKSRLPILKTHSEEAGVELLNLLVGMLNDGRLTDVEIKMLRDWLAANRTFDLPAIAFLAETLTDQKVRFALLPGEWRPDSDELTATMKLKRAAILHKYADEIDALYRDSRQSS